MSEKQIIFYCAPTLAGIKTGNLYACFCPDKAQLAERARRFNAVFVPKGLQLLPVRFSNQRALIYVFRPNKLKADLSAAEARSLLREFGYPCCDPMPCLAELIRRLHSDRAFPHEIGLFLGYPPEDVRGFIEQKGANSKCTGWWKVYGDAPSAQKQFSRFEKCVRLYCEQWSRGRSLDQLTVGAFAAVKEE